MDRILLTKIAITVPMLMCVFATIIISTPPMTKVKNEPVIYWETTTEGVPYYFTYIEGCKMIVTRSTQYKFQMAGPIGDCTY